ncbi:hypothetical protein RI129_005931 [Pyrocoelia pectoralis]|uniref:beta-N-acetylhexosaminidase n=1 Tax=Pyrocoelia pectoralis TaxID=417401 RepID=A0AAN7ZP15_9COLE
MNYFKKHLTFNRKWRKIIYVVFFVTFVILTIFYCFPFQKRNQFKFGKLTEYIPFQRNVHFELAEKIVHLDLKGAPPKVAYFNTLFPFLSKLGVTGLLIEYEDMFPYAGTRSIKIPACNAYSMEDISTIRRLAKENNLNVIPLVQVFGHMEFVLKLEDFAEFREVRRYPQMICPTHQTTPEIVIEMIDEIVKAHPNIDRLHIGADEVMYLGECDRCKDYIRAHNINTNDLFLLYITTIITKIRQKYPSLRILMWDDHFRSMKIDELRKSQIGGIVEPVVWNYRKDVEQWLGMWEKYEEIFPKVWIASAFKGATGPKQVIPDVSHHVENHKSWLRVLNKYKDGSIRFKGIILTGWQRYDHFAVLCELLPVGIPSLVMCLQSLQIDNSANAMKLLNCDGDAYDFQNCRFPGSNVYDAIMKYQQLTIDLEIFAGSDRVVGWMDNYNIRNNYSNTYFIEQASLTLDSLQGSLLNIKTIIYESMSTVYDNFTINEWFNVYVKPISSKIESYMLAKSKLLNIEYWSKKSLIDDNEL